MKIVEGLKKLKIIQKCMLKNNLEIEQYASILSTDRPIFVTEELQRKEILERIQSNEDYAKNYMSLKMDIEYTNLVTTVEIDGKVFTISELLVIKRNLAKIIIGTYSSLNENTANKRKNLISNYGDKTVVNNVILYSEIKKNEGLKKWQELEDKISGRLEVINATTELVQCPSCR